jgi:hypothetical protein
MDANATAAAAYQDIIRKQDRDLKQLKQQVKQLQVRCCCCSRNHTALMFSDFDYHDAGA